MRHDNRGMERFNLFTAECEDAPGRPDGYRCATARMWPVIGASRIAATVYELPAGESSAPYHYEYGCEEWLIVLAGSPTLRHPDGEDELAPGDTVCFPEGPAGAHKVTNHGDAAARIMILSTVSRPAVVVFPDSEKLGVWTGGEPPLQVERSSAVDYWKGEA